MPTNYKRTIQELEAKAVKWWPKFLKEQVAEKSGIPTLVASLDQFLDLLKQEPSTPESIFDLVEHSELAGNLFLKHLTLLADIGSELLKKINGEARALFYPDSVGSTEGEFRFSWRGSPCSYPIRRLPCRGFSSEKLHIDGKSISRPHPLDEVKKELAMLLLHGASADNEILAQGPLENCVLGSLLGRSEALEAFVRERYLHVSTITAGSTANSLGNAAQAYAKATLKEILRDTGVDVRSGKILASSGKEYNFDILLECPGFKIGIEMSFQVTGNSTISQKRGRAEERYSSLKKDGHFLAYIIDGVGNFQRTADSSPMCENSDCTVAFSDEEFKVLADFVREKLH